MQIQDRPIAAAKQTVLREVALRIETAFGVKRDTLMRMWAAYEIGWMRKREMVIGVRRVLRAG